MAITGILVLLLLGSAAVGIALHRTRPAQSVRAARLGAATAFAAAIIGSPWSVDGLAALVTVFVTFMGVVVGRYAASSLAAEPRAPRFFVAANLVVASMAVLAAATTPALMAIGWVAVSGATVALIASSGRTPAVAAARTAARRFLLADAVVLAGLATAWWAADDGGTIGAAAQSIRDESSTLATVVGLALLVGAAGRSALVPFHGWLTSSVAAPTPVSAMLHAGVVNGSAVVLIRWFGVFTAPVVGVLVVTAATSIVVGMAAARTRPDVKGGLAWTTVAQMGFMALQCALGLFGPAVVHMIGHGLFKSSLFLGSASGLDRGPAHGHPATRAVPKGRALGAAVTGAVAVAVALAVVRPHFAEHPAAVVPVAFLWATVAYALAQWWSRVPTIDAKGGLGATGAALAATTAAVAVSSWVDALAGVAHDAAPAGAAGLAWGVVAGAALVAAIGTGTPRVAADLAARAWLWFAHPRLPSLRTVAPPPGVDRSAWRRGVTAATADPPSVETRRRARMRATVDEAAQVLAPAFPLERFVAVNPLIAFEDRPHHEALVVAGRELGVRTEHDEATYREWHRAGRITTDDLRAAVRSHFDRRGEASTTGHVDAVVDGLLNGPGATVAGPRPVLLSEWHDHATGRHRSELVDEIASWWTARYLSTHPAWPMPRRSEGLWVAWRRLARFDARVISPAWQPSLHVLPEHPEDALARALVELGIGQADHRDYLRRHLVRTRGWSSALRNGTGDASDDLVAYLAIRLTIEAALMSNSEDRRNARRAAEAEVERRDEPTAERLAIWRDAYERSYRDELLSTLGSARTVAPAAGSRPAVQSVFCIDARSEGVRRHLERTGSRHETIGFAGFFGLPVAVQDLGAPEPVPSCPVILAPSVTVAEVDHSPRCDLRSARSTELEAAHDVYSATKRSTLTPFAFAEAAGWWSGVSMVGRTFAPGATDRLRRAVRDRIVPAAATHLEAVDGHLTLDERVDLAAAILTTTGLASSAAPLVLLCGHRSGNVNNLHRAALDCGACGGRGGGNNARLAALILNDPEVRAALRERHVLVPDDTLFVAGEHDTTSDTITLFDLESIPADRRVEVAELRRDLDVATAALAGERARDLPGRLGGAAPQGRDGAVRRGADWSQVVPEWGLAGNAALIVGPRSLTAACDLRRRAFLHSYSADDDLDGSTLAAILGGPMMVAHWISSQYRFSTIDPDRLGAGSKPTHNFVEGVGVLAGAGGDLRVGLPLESTSMAGEPVHESMRLLVVVDAPAPLVDLALAADDGVTNVARHQWVRLVARSVTDDAPGSWVEYGADGRWRPIGEPEPRRTTAGDLVGAA